jgi:hypothetical protein
VSACVRATLGRVGRCEGGSLCGVRRGLRGETRGVFFLFPPAALLVASGFDRPVGRSALARLAFSHGAGPALERRHTVRARGCCFEHSTHSSTRGSRTRSVTRRVGSWVCAAHGALALDLHFPPSLSPCWLFLWHWWHWRLSHRPLLRLCCGRVCFASQLSFPPIPSAHI